MQAIETVSNASYKYRKTVATYLANAGDLI